MELAIVRPRLERRDRAARSSYPFSNACRSARLAFDADESVELLIEIVDARDPGSHRGHDLRQHGAHFIRIHSGLDAGIV
jgi:hypothetical protein